MLKILLLALLMSLISGCTSIRFFELEPRGSEISQQEMVELVDLDDLNKLPTHLLHNQCLTINKYSDVGNALLAQCAQELLRRDDLSLSLKSYALTSYNDSILNLMRLGQSKKAIVKVVIEEKGEYLIVNDIKVREKELIPSIYGELGVPIVVRENNSQQGLSKYYPAEGIYSSRTILFKSLEHDDQFITVKLSTRREKLTTIGRNYYPLKFSPGAAFLALIENATIDNFSWLGFTNANQAEKRRGIFSIGDISKTKTPIIMIHGLNSDPLIWRNLTMAILNDKKIHEHFQVWHVYYPSGPPPFFNAMRIRKQLKEFINDLDAPELYSQAIIIGHSMGGVISRTLTTNSQDKLWNVTFTERYEDMDLKQDSPLKDIFVFSPIFEEATVFFLDTPHRGSNVATSVIGSIGSAFVTLPDNFKSIFKRFINRVGIEKITSTMQPFLVEHGPNSVQVLRPGHPLMEVLVELPIQGESYSIIGSNSKLICKHQVDCDQISDGVVSYGSAYLEDAADTIIVKSSHDSFKNPEAIFFILDKLKRKMNQSGL